LYAFVMALRAGDFSARLPTEESNNWRVREIALHLNNHIQQMERMISEVRRVCDEVGVQGRLGPQAEPVFPPGNPWAAMVDAVNVLAANLTCQLRDFNRSVALMNLGDSSRPLTCPCDGETLELQKGLNQLRERVGNLPASAK